MRAAISLISRKGNRYLFDKGRKKSLLCHPVLFYIQELHKDGVDIARWIEEHTGDQVNIEGAGRFPISDFKYYFRKWQLLKQNGYFGEINQEKALSKRLTAEDIEASLANTRQVTFEVTEKCPLKCKYCGYGEFYDDYGEREKLHMPLNIPVNLLTYLAGFWNSGLNRSHRKDIYIGFYGGEPLENFPLVKEVVKFAGRLKLEHNSFSFSMTTNGVLLHKYMDFLVKHNFNLLISLDGDEANNQYRVWQSGKPAFRDIMKNIEQLNREHPAFFKTNVSFNAVLHNKNSVSEIFNYVKDRFAKVPRISTLNTAGVKESEKKAFWETYSNLRQSLLDSEDYSFIEKEMFVMLPTLRDLSLFLFQCNDFAFANYSQMLSSRAVPRRYPSGTCIPFSKKVFVTAKGGILPCERISHEHMLGNVESKSVAIDFQHVADKYNRMFEKMSPLCTGCNNAAHCIQCLFNLESPEGNAPVCNGFMTYKDYSDYISAHIDYLEKEPEIFTKIFKEVFID